MSLWRGGLWGSQRFAGGGPWRGGLWASQRAGGGGGGESELHRYWRVYVTDTNDGGNIQLYLAEGEFRSQAGTAEIPSGGTAIGSDSFGSGFEFAQAFDGDPATGWSTPDNDPLPHWVGYDFGAEQAVEELLLQAGDTSARANRAPIDFTLDYSDDGVSWTPLAHVSADPAWSIGEIRTYAIQLSPPYLAWRIVVTESVAADSGDSFDAAVAELQFRAEAGVAEVHSGGTALGSSSAGSSTDFDKAFDDDASTLWTANLDTLLPQFVGYQFAAERDVAEVYIQAGDTQARADRCPSAFVLQGAADGSAWVDVATFSGLSAWSPGETRTFSVT